MGMCALEGACSRKVKTICIESKILRKMILSFLHSLASSGETCRSQAERPLHVTEILLQYCL